MLAQVFTFAQRDKLSIQRRDLVDITVAQAEDGRARFSRFGKRPYEGANMSYYMMQVAYSAEGWQALVKNPQNRVEAVRPAIEGLGGRIENAWYSFAVS